MATAPIPDLMQSFLDEAWEAVTVFEQTPEFLAVGRHEPLTRMAHRLKGSAGLYGFPQTSRLAALMERILEGASRYTDPQQATVVEFVAQANACLIESLESVAATGRESRVGLELGRLGASQLIWELARANPEAFAPQPAEPQIQPDQSAQSGQSEKPGQTAARPAAHEAVAEALRKYHRENAEFWEFFAPETLENLEAVGRALEAMRHGDAAGEHLTALFRAMHTVKGAAYSVGCKPVGELAHKLEDLLVAVREGGKPWDEAVARVVLEGADAVATMLAVAEGKPGAAESLGAQLTAVHAQLARQLGLEIEPEPQSAQTERAEQTEPAEQTVRTPQAEQAAQPAPAPQPQPAPARASVRVGLDRLDSLMNLAGETLIAKSRLELLVRRFEDLDAVLETARQRLLRTTADFEARYLNPRLAMEQSEAGAPGAPSTSLGKTVTELFSELEFDRYDDLNILARSIGEMVGDLAEVRGGLSEQIKAFRQETEGFGKLSQSLRGEVGRARLVPVGRFFSRLQRQVRQVAGDKAVRLELSGENLELDSTVLDGLAEALIHLVNNAVIHGLESPAEREAAFKPREGRLSLRARLQRNTLVLEIEDDGRGIDPEALKQKAVERGLRSAQQVAALTPQQAVDLIFLPGLSTAQTVTAEAGRGVGMDAVASAVRRVRGELSVETRAGLGTTFRLRVPQSIVVSDILLLEAGGRGFALPRESIVTLLAAGREALETGWVVHEGQEVPVRSLAALLGLPETPDRAEASLALVEGRGGLVALAADRFVGLEQALVKPLGEPLSLLPHLAGASLSATGEVHIVLSPAGLLSMENRGGAAAVEAAPAQLAPLLVVDDSLSVRRVVGQMLRRGGHPVVTAADGQEALEMLDGQEFRAVITDLEMPRLSGFELLEEMRRRPRLSGLPVAVLTTRASSKHRDLALELGANAYLTKPLDEVELQRFLAGI